MPRPKRQLTRVQSDPQLPLGMLEIPNQLLPNSGRPHRPLHPREIASANLVLHEIPAIKQPEDHFPRSYLLVQPPALLRWRERSYD